MYNSHSLEPNQGVAIDLYRNVVTSIRELVMPFESKMPGAVHFFRYCGGRLFAGLTSVVILAFVCPISYPICYSQSLSAAESSTNDTNPTKSPLLGMDAVLGRFTNSTQPVIVPPISFVDVNSGRFGKLVIDLEDGQFLDTAVDKLNLQAKDLDVQAGTLGSLHIFVQGGHIHDFIFDKLQMDTDGNLKFDSGTLLNHRLLQFESPAQANVSVTISQQSLNRFLSSPKTLERLSITANKKAGALVGLASLVGIKVNQIGLSVDSADVKLERHNKFKMNFVSRIGLGDLGLPINGQIEGQLALEDGILTIADAHVSTGGQEIPQELSKFLLKKINLIPALSQKSEDIHFNFTNLKVLSGKQIQLRGTAAVNRLRFGNKN